MRTRTILFAIAAIALVGILIYERPEQEQTQTPPEVVELLFGAGSISAPEYVAGVDGGGLTNSGTDAAPTFGATTGGKGVLVSGNYAYVVTTSSTTACSVMAGNGNGCELKIFDISTPTNPTYVGGGNADGTTNAGTDAGGAFNGIAKSGNYVFITKDSDTSTCSNAAGSGDGCEFQVWDVSDPAAPAYVAGGDVTGNVGSGTGGVDLYAIEISGSYAYTVGAGSTTACAGAAGTMRCELMVWDISTPTAPTYASGGDASGSSESGTTSSTFRDLVILGTNAYIVKVLSATTCSITAGSAVGCELQAWDISTPTAVAYVGGGDRSGATNASTTATSNMTKITGSGNYVYTSGGAGAASNGCTGTAGFAAGCELMVWDISTPSTPTYVDGGDAGGGVNTESGNIDPYGMATTSISGSTYLFQTYTGSATDCDGAVGTRRCEVQIWDITTPTSITYVAGLDASGSTNDGVGNLGFNSVAAGTNHIYTVGSGSATECTGTIGSAIGCEMKVWEIVASAAPAPSGARDAVIWISEDPL